MGRVYMKPYDTTRSFVVARGKAALQAARRRCWSCPLAGRLSGLRRELTSIEGAAHDGVFTAPRVELRQIDGRSTPGGGNSA